MLSACCRLLTVTLGYSLPRTDASCQIRLDITSLSSEAGVLPVTINTCVCGLKMVTAASPKGFLFPRCHRRNGNDYEIEREEKSRQMKQEMLPQKGTCLFLVNLHKQKDMGQQDHKHAQANTKQVRFHSCCSRISKPLLSRLRANFCQD